MQRNANNRAQKTVIVSCTNTQHVDDLWWVYVCETGMNRLFSTAHAQLPSRLIYICDGSWRNDTYVYTLVFIMHADCFLRGTNRSKKKLSRNLSLYESGTGSTTCSLRQTYKRCGISPSTRVQEIRHSWRGRRNSWRQSYSTRKRNWINAFYSIIIKRLIT